MPQHIDPESDDVENAIVVKGQRPRGSVVTDIPPEASVNVAVIKAFNAVDLNEVFADLAPEIGNGGTGQPPIVLVNGQRIAGFSTIKDIPPDSVSRIEVFPEQVALQYGFGPGQRVVNVVLRENYRALLLLARDTLEPENWRWVYEGKVDFMRIGANSHWNLDVDYQHEGAIYSSTTLAGATPSPDGSTAVLPYTLLSQKDDLNISGSYNRNYGSVNAEFAAHLDLKTLQSRLGLADQDGALLASQGLSALANGPLGRIDNTIDAQTSVTLNGRLDSWRWSFIGALDATSRQTRTGDTLLTNGFGPVSLPSPTLLGQGCGASMATSDCVATDTQKASGDAYLNGDLFALPAGAVTAAFHTGFAFSDIQAYSVGASGSTDHSRSEANLQANLEFPLTARDSWLGKLTGGVNGGVSQLSDFGTLSTIGTSAQWSPVRSTEFIVSFTRQEQAPDLLQLGEAALVTPDVREFDFTNGQTSIVQRTEGGNIGLSTQTSNIARFRAQVSPFPAADLTLSAEYTIDRTRNPIVALTAATSAAEAAFPDRFTRTGTGYLTAMDVSPVNIASRNQQQLRWGGNYTKSFGSSWISATDPRGGPKRDQFEIALYHTWRFQDEAVLQEGQPALDLLGHDIISDLGGTSRHQIELQTTLSERQWSFAVNGAWQSPTSASPDATPFYRLTFSNGVTLNLKLQIHLAELHWLTRIFPQIKSTLRLSADNVLNAHLNVHDATGAVPPSYSTAYLNPTGPTFRITIRKAFY